MRYRQDILRDVLANPLLVRQLYDLTIEARDVVKKAHTWVYNNSPSTILGRSVTMVQMFVVLFKQLRGVGTYNAQRFSSDGFKTLFSMLDRELSDDYFVRIQDHLKRLSFRDGVWVSAVLGEGNKGADYTLRRSNERPGSWIARLTTPKPPAYTWRLAARDEAGANALGELRDRGLNLVANALAKSDDHILSFFAMLRAELAFYVGCLNLQEQLAKKVQPISFPTPAALSKRKLTFRGLYDVCLTFKTEQRVVGNDVNADGKDFVIITGADTGGKRTFLRSVGLAQLMMQCGMSSPPKSFSANMCSHLFTHYVREEDTTMKSGKLDEELSRFSGIVTELAPDAFVLFNKSSPRRTKEKDRRLRGRLLPHYWRSVSKYALSRISMILHTAFMKIRVLRFFCAPSGKPNANGDANCAALPSCASISSRRLYFAMRSLRLAEPVLICPPPIATVKSARNVSSVSPER